MLEQWQHICQEKIALHCKASQGDPVQLLAKRQPNQAKQLTM